MNYFHAKPHINNIYQVVSLILKDVKNIERTQKNMNTLREG
jgi:hypothetical protein